MKISKILLENIFTFKIDTETLNNPSLYLLEKFFQQISKKSAMIRKINFSGRKTQEQNVNFFMLFFY